MVRPLSARAVFKFIIPAFGTFSLIVLCYGDPQKGWAVFPATVIALYLSAADLRIEDARVRYRRFLSWKDLPPDVAGARCLPLPPLGYIRFRHYLPSFGVLFYIVEREEGDFVPLSRTKLMKAIVSSQGGEIDAPAAHPPDRLGALPGDDRVRLRWILIAIASMLAGVFVPDLSPAVPRWTGVLKAYWDVLQLLNRPVPQVAYAAFLAWFLIRKRLQGIVSAVVACLLGGIVAHLIRLL
jgi:hypothetical protein